MSNQRDFQFIWRLRAIWIENIRIEGDPAFDNANGCWMWFVGDPVLDEFFAHGISDVATEAIAERISETLDDGDIAALLPYAGESWQTITSLSPVAFGTQQRTLAVALRGDSMAKLRQMSREQILALRASESPADKAMWN